MEGIDAALLKREGRLDDGHFERDEVLGFSSHGKIIGRYMPFVNSDVAEAGSASVNARRKAAAKSPARARLPLAFKIAAVFDLPIDRMFLPNGRRPK